MIDSRRRLPHWIPDGVPVFVTFRLAGSLPGPLGGGLRSQAGIGFFAADCELDRAERGPVWLWDRRVAAMVIQALRYGESVKRWYSLHAFVVMPNHVHLVWTPVVSMSRVLQWLKERDE